MIQKSLNIKQNYNPSEGYSATKVTEKKWGKVISQDWQGISLSWTLLDWEGSLIMAQALGKSDTDWNSLVLLGSLLDKTHICINFLTHAERILVCES